MPDPDRKDLTPEHAEYVEAVNGEPNPERWRQVKEGVDPAHTDILAALEAEKAEKAVEALSRELRFFLARWRYVHPQQFDSDAARDLAREVLGKFT